MSDRFILEFARRTADGWIGAAYLRRFFARQPDGSYVCSVHGSTVWIRCIAHHDGWFEHVDSGGEVVYDYRRVPVRPETGDT